MQIVVNHLLTSYTIIGEGRRTILCLHGWADTGQTFSSLAKELIKDNEDTKVVLLDLPGFGSTQTPPKPWELKDYAEFVAEFTRKADLKTVVIVGHSNGGAIAITGLASGVLEADKLVLIASAGVRPSSAKKTALKIVSKPAKLALKVAPPATQKRLRKKAYDAIGSDYLVAEHMQDTFVNVVSNDVTKQAAELTMPVCLIYGEADTATPVVYGEKFRNVIPTATLYVIPEASHFVHQEQVPKVGRFITDFIKE